MDSKGKQHSHDKNDLLLDLNFVPTWARKPPGVNPYVTEGAGEGGRDRGGSRRPQDRDRRPGGDRRSQRRERPRGEQQVTRHEWPSRRETAGEPRTEPRPRARAEFVDLPLDMHFIPEKQRLGAVVKQIRSAVRAYPLMDIAGLFLSNPDNYLIKVEARREGGKTAMRLYQCTLCKIVFAEREKLLEHLMTKHLDEMFTVVEEEGDAPTGNFVCVGRCSISGEMIGPPNYHGFEERIQQLHRQRFGHMSYDDYRARVEMVHDLKAVEEWKEAARKQRFFIPKGVEEAEKMTWTQAEQYFATELASKYVHASSKIMLPAGSSRHQEDANLQHVLRRAWNRESRHPFTLSIALRPAFKHMGLHLFKAGKGITFVTSVKPHPLDPTHAVDSIREVLEYLQEKPGVTRKQLVVELRGEDHSPEKVAEVMTPLRWLIERGHVIEFFNGTLSVPGASHKKA